ncbi:MAG: hypothetical protein KA198_07120 [Chitinophagaceae bacterium]|nr:hypothetical protein [Chitinophagaceae bacterium]
MVGIFKRNDALAFASLLVLHLVLKIKVILHPPEIANLEKFYQGFFFQWKWLKQFYIASPGIYIFLSSILFFLFILYVNVIVNEERLFYRKSYVPALSLVLFSAFIPELCLFSTIFIANVFIFIAFAKTLLLYSHAKPRKACFDIGLFVALASLFYFPAILLIFLFILIFALLRPLVIQEIFAFLIGILTSFYFAITLSYLLGNWTQIKSKLNFHLFLPLKINNPIIFISSTLVGILLLVYGMFLLNQHGPKNPIAVRKKWNAVVLYAFFGLLAGLFSSVFPGLPWLLAITPFSIILSQTFQNNKEKFNIFTFYFIIIALIIGQWYT